jgi:hypothetical protein
VLRVEDRLLLEYIGVVLPSNCVISANGGTSSDYLYSKMNWNLFRHGSTIFGLGKKEACAWITGFQFLA